MECKEFSRVGERMYSRVLDNGLHVFVFPKPDFQKSYAFFAANYGGMDMRFRLEGKEYDTPAGVAHYLEHKMFDTQEGNALQDLAANGASPNAFTSSAITGYYFESTDKFEENLKILLSFVSVPWFTQESVDKERGIIGQEIGMIEDNPDWRVYTNLMAGLYASHPVRVSVAGSVESISHITPDTLYACHRAFYVPCNMALCVAGNVDPEQVCRLAREVLPKAPGSAAGRDYGPPEPEEAARPLVEQRMEVSTPIFQLGFKGQAAPRGEETLRRQLLGELALEALLGSSSPLYARLYAQGLINAGFSYGYESNPGCAFLCAGGESRDPAAVRDAVLAEGERIAREGVDPRLWSRLKKACYGGRVRALNSFEHLCVEQAQAHFAGFDFLAFPRVFEPLSEEDAREMIQGWVRPERACLSVILPREEPGV
ncbi:MAG: insulinase family protein [Lawsonibacter sp.]|nr:insulinase family protein [Lawsonibacter sp.]